MTIKFAALLFVSSTALALSNALPVQSFPQWITINGEEGKDLLYDFNSLKSLPNGVKQIDTYYPSLKQGFVQYISCPRWRRNIAGEKKWDIISPDSTLEALAYKLCGGVLPKKILREKRSPPCTDNSLECALHGIDDL